MCSNAPKICLHSSFCQDMPRQPFAQCYPAAVVFLEIYIMEIFLVRSKEILPNLHLCKGVNTVSVCSFPCYITSPESVVNNRRKTVNMFGLSESKTVEPLFFLSYLWFVFLIPNMLLQKLIDTCSPINLLNLN